MKKIIIKNKLTHQQQISIKKIQRIESPHTVTRFEIGGRNTTYNKLISLFDLPLKIDLILNESPEILKSRHEVKIYLLSKFKKIKHLIIHDINYLNDFIDKWIDKSIVINRLTFEDKCEIPDHCNFIDVPNIGQLSIQNPEQARTIIKTWKFQKPGFDLIRENNKFFIEISYISDTNKLSINPQIKDPQNQNFGWGTKAYYLFKAIKMIDKENHITAKNIVITDMGKLDGIAVSGGAPSLGKK